MFVENKQCEKPANGSWSIIKDPRSPDSHLQEVHSLMQPLTSHSPTHQSLCHLQATHPHATHAITHKPLTHTPLTLSLTSHAFSPSPTDSETDCHTRRGNIQRGTVSQTVGYAEICRSAHMKSGRTSSGGVPYMRSQTLS